MKKLFLIAMLVLIVAALAAAPALANAGRGNIKGEVTAINTDGSLTILTARGETLTVVLPPGMALGSIAVGDTLIVKGTRQPDGSILASRVMEVGRGGEDDDPEDGHGRMNGAYCADGKQVKPHPLAVKLSEQYGVTPEWVMGHFCEGHGMGAIMLALKMAETYGANADELLAQRAAGQGWGQIWRENGWIGRDEDGDSPPGRLNKPDKPGRNN